MALAAGLYWAALLASHQYMQRYTRDQAWLRVSQMSQAVSAQAGTMLSGLNYSLRDLARDYESGDSQAFGRAVASVQEAYPPGTIVQVAVADANGQVVYSSLAASEPPAQSVSILDREHFQAHLKGLTQGTFIGRPVQGRVSGQWGIQLSRALHHRGAFAGVLVVSLSPQYLSRQLQAIFDSPRDVILLLREDGTYLARSQNQDRVLGRQLPATRVALFAPDVTHGTYEALASTDGIQRMYAWSRVSGFPILVSTGLDHEAVFGPLNETIRQSLWRNGIGTLLIFLGGMLTAWLAFQRWREEDQRVQSEERFHLLSEEVPGGLFQYSWDPAGHYALSFANPGFYAMHCIDADTAGTALQDLAQRVHPEDISALRQSIDEAMRSHGDWACKYRVQSADGSVRWLQGHARPQRTEDATVLWHGYILDVTQDESLRKALHESEERLRLTIGAVRDGLWQWDREQDQVLWDARCYQMLGMPDQALGSFTVAGFMHLLHPLDQPRVQERLRRHLEHGDPFRVEMRIRQADGSWRWIESRGEVTLRDADNKALRMLGMHTDIQERVEQTHMVGALLERGSALVLVASHRRSIVYANAQAAECFGLAAGALEPQCSFQQLHPSSDSFHSFASLYERLSLKGTVRTEWALKVKGGHMRWFDMQGALLDPEDPQGNVIWTLFDVDARHQAESALHEVQQRLEAIIEKFPAGILVTDDAGQCIRASNAMLVDLFELPLSATDLVGKSLQTLLSYLPPAMATALQPAPQPGAGALSQRTIFALSNGRHIETELLPLRRQERLLGYCWVFHDVTDYKRRETQLEALALTDALTGASNRRAFITRMESELEHLRLGLSHPSALIMLDIDHFKRVNDSFGHGVGDEVLRHLVIAVSKQLRQGDMLGRLGGEEFAVLLTDVDAPTALRRAENLREAVAALAVSVQGQDSPIRFTVSLGVCLMDEGEASVERCLERADAAMYFSKRNGRNRTTCWTPDTPVISDAK